MKNIICVLLCFMGLSSAVATETEHLDFHLLPKPGPVTVDGDDADWDLSSGIFACGDVENARDNFAVWIHGMYDADNVYILARWIDRTPMNHPGSTKGDYGFNGDCLQLRVVTAPDISAPAVGNMRAEKDAEGMRTTHMTCWRDRDGVDVIDIEYGHKFNEGKVKDAKTIGAQQAFKKSADARGYTQEIAIPWKVLCKPEYTPKAGDRILLTVEPNFTIGSAGRLTIKDIFKSGVGIDRVFTFSGNGCWGFGKLEQKGQVAPRPVRLSDGREFPVHMENRYPVIDWSGVVKSREPEGFKPIKFTMPEDGYVSLNIFNADDSVARQLLMNAFYTKGEHDVKWDGLATMSVRKPGKVLSAGDYKWEGIYHTGIGLRLRGWAGNSGSAPWGSETWGADHGNPIACAANSQNVFLGWGGGEGAKPLQAVDSNGNIKWKNIRGGIATAGPIAADDTTVYAFNAIGQYATSGIYRVDARTGNYTEWSALKSTDLTMKDLWGDMSDAPKGPSALAAKGSRVFIGFHDKDAIFVVDAKTGKTQKTLTVKKPGAIAAASADKIFVASEGGILSINVDSGEATPAFKLELAEGNWPSALALNKAGDVFVGIRGKNHVVQVFGADGKFIRTIGRDGGRALLGKWTPDGFLNISGLAIDAKDQLWVSEDDETPRRVSVWDAFSGAFKMEFFGATSYGATGGAVNPTDPSLMVGQGCEWKLDAQTGKASCLGVITRGGMNGSKFGFGENGKVYLAVTPGFLHGVAPVRIFERVGDANYKLRTQLSYDEKSKTVSIWADENDDAVEQPNEIKSYNIDLGGWIQGWYLSMASDLSFYGTMYQIKVTGWTACGAPIYDLSKAVKLPAPENARLRGGMGAQRGMGSADGKYMLWNAGYGEDHGTVDCYDIASGKLAWTYPSNFTGVHGSHRACSAEVGMIRGAYDVVGSALLPNPVGNIWVIATNKGEWHALTEKGFYLTKFFEGDPMKNVWPEKATPGAIIDGCPPGAGEEAFGGSIACSKEGKLSLQAGHTSFWNVEVTGLETVRSLPNSGSVSLTPEDIAKAQECHEKYLQDSSGAKQISIKKMTPTFTGNLQKDFANANSVSFQKMASAAVRSAFAYDTDNLYVAWEVKDDTPWVNGADAPEFLYARGDTVDLQLGSDPKAKADRTEAALGDLRLSIGAYKQKPTAVIYRKVAKNKNPKSFNSGVTKDYVMESVVVASDVRIEVKIDPVKKAYTVEAAIPFKALEFTPEPGMKIRGDVGVTHGNKAGDDTALRSYWSNQQTGLVSDEVFELQMTPKNWGDLVFEK